MTAVALGLLSGWLVLRLAGTPHRYPWRLLDLDQLSAAAHTRDAPSAPSSLPRRTRVRGVGRQERRELRRVEADLPAAVDLVHVAVSAGHTLHGAVAAAGRSGTGPVCEALADVDERFRNGSSLVDELDRLPGRLGPAVRPLSTTLALAASSGAPLGPTLQRLADSERRRVRRRTEERVRRLPVLLLAPLVGLVLPAFVLLTVAPVAITTARVGLTPLTQEPAGTPDLPSRSTDSARTPP